MSDFAEGWLVWHARRADLVAAIAAERTPAFVFKKARPLIAFPREALRVVKRVSGRLEEAVLVAFSAGDDHGELSLWCAGRSLASVKTTGRLTTRAQVLAARRLLAAAATRNIRVDAGAVALGDPVPSSGIHELGVGYGRLESLSYESLFASRLDGESPADEEVEYLDEAGNKQPYALVASLASPVRDARSLPLDLDATPQSLIDAMKRLDPAKATTAARDQLEQLVRVGPRGKGSRDRLRVAREMAASLLAQCLDALPDRAREQAVHRLCQELPRAAHATDRAMIALALRRGGAAAKPLLEKALRSERDPEAARRVYEALRDLRHELPDAVLLERAASDDVLERKGAYALLEQSAAPQTLDALGRLRVKEADDSARALLDVVVERLRTELEG